MQTHGHRNATLGLLAPGKPRNDTCKDLKTELSDWLCYTGFQPSQFNRYRYGYIWGKKIPAGAIPAPRGFISQPGTVCWVGFPSDQGRQEEGERKNKGLQGGGGRLHTRTRARLASPAARFTTKCCVWGDAHMGVRHPKTSGETASLASLTNQMLARGALLQRQGGGAPKDVQTTPKSLTCLHMTWEIWEDDWYQHFPPLSRHSWVLDDHTHSWEPQVPMVGKLRWNANVEFKVTDQIWGKLLISAFLLFSYIFKLFYEGGSRNHLV